MLYQYLLSTAEKMVTSLLGTAAYEKRGVAVSVPVLWMLLECIQCNQCSYVCPHATIRPVLLTDEEAAAAPANFGAVPGVRLTLAGKYQFKIAGISSGLYWAVAAV